MRKCNGRDDPPCPSKSVGCRTKDGGSSVYLPACRPRPDPIGGRLASDPYCGEGVFKFENCRDFLTRTMLRGKEVA